MTTKNTEEKYETIRVTWLKDRLNERDAALDTVKLLRDKLALSEAHHKRLAEELPKMRKENRRLMQFIQDAAAFIRSAHSDKTWNDNIVLATLCHDITGLANDERCFSPRVTGYAQREQEKK